MNTHRLPEFSVETGVKQIPNEMITVDDIPIATADWNSIRDFAYTFDAYDFGLSCEECGDIANELMSAYRDGKQLTVPLTTLRIALFFEARRWRHFDSDPRSSNLEYIQVIVKEIRSILQDADRKKS